MSVDTTKEEKRWWDPLMQKRLKGVFRKDVWETLLWRLVSWAAPAAGAVLTARVAFRLETFIPLLTPSAHEQTCIQHLLCAKNEAPRPFPAPGTHMGTLAGDLSPLVRAVAPGPSH